MTLREECALRRLGVPGSREREDERVVSLDLAQPLPEHGQAVAARVYVSVFAISNTNGGTGGWLPDCAARP